MRNATFEILILVMITSFLSGCGQGPNEKVPMFKQSSDTDVTSSPTYNFNLFAGTIWKTKVKVALADLTAYTGRHEITLLSPRSFDMTHPEYNPPPTMKKVMAELPVGTKLRIDRLMKDNGNWGGVQVTALLEDVTTSLESGTVIYLSNYLLAKNRFIWPGSNDSKEWSVDPDMLEKAK